MVWRGLDGVPSRPSGDQPWGAWMALNIHVLPQAGVFAETEPALWQASGLPRSFAARPAGPCSAGEWAGLAQLRRPGTVADAVGRFLAEWAS
jgi:hypothetical protein